MFATKGNLLFLRYLYITGAFRIINFKTAKSCRLYPFFSAVHKRIGFRPHLACQRSKSCELMRITCASLSSRCLSRYLDDHFHAIFHTSGLHSSTFDSLGLADRELKIPKIPYHIYHRSSLGFGQTNTHAHTMTLRRHWIFAAVGSYPDSYAKIRTPLLCKCTYLKESPEDQTEYEDVSKRKHCS